MRNVFYFSPGSNADLYRRLSGLRYTANSPIMHHSPMYSFSTNQFIYCSLICRFLEAPVKFQRQVVDVYYTVF